METPTLFSAFIGGVLSFLSPCILPLIPAYFSYITGVSVEELKNRNTISILILNSLFFVFGFSTIFLFLGFASSFIGSFFLEQKGIIEKIAGIFIIILSIHLMGFYRIKFLDVERKVEIKAVPLPLLRSFFVGLAFGFGWTPCIGPILAAILAVAASQGSAIKGTILLSFYSLGLAIPFMISALSLNLFFILFKGIRKHLRKIELFAGIFLFILGILLLTGIFSKLSFGLGV